MKGWITTLVVQMERTLNQRSPLHLHQQLRKLRLAVTNGLKLFGSENKHE